MRKLFIIVFSFLALSFVFAYSAKSYAYDPFADTCTNADSSATVCSDKNNTANPLTGTSGLLLRAARFLTFITGVASVLIVIYAGLKYVTADGDSNTISQAKSTITYALVGLIVSSVAQAIIIFVINGVK